MAILADDEGNGETVLVVEDNPSARIAMEAILEALGYHVLMAENGHEALDLYRAQPDVIALVISDLIMPEMGGPELYVALKADYPALKMMIMTGYPFDDGGQMLASQGIHHWIQKPFTMKELSSAIREVLNTGS